MKTIQSQLFKVYLLPVLVLCLASCMMAEHTTGDEEGSVVWKGNKDYGQRVETFKVTPGEASKKALEEMKKPGAFKLMRSGVFAEAEFVVGRWYWFGIATKTAVYATGYYVNGDTGAIEYRESDLVLEKQPRSLAKSTWSRVVPLPKEQP